MTKTRFSFIYFIFLLFGALFFGLLLQNNRIPQLSNLPKKAIIIGATSGIGRALAIELAKRNYIIGVTGRRKKLLDTLAQEIPNKTYIKSFDISDTNKAREELKELIKEMGDVDIIIINAGTGNLNLDWQKQKEIIDINVLGFTSMASIATDYFFKKGIGQLVGISSISALRGSAGAPTYSASKAFISNYLSGLQAHFQKMGKSIYVTDIQPGLVDTAMGQVSSFWRATPKEAAFQIANAIEQKRKHAYITKRWQLIAWLFKALPDFIFYRIF